MNREEALAELDDLYAQLPALECKGRCHDSCTSINMTELERERIRARGVEIGPSMTHARVKKLVAAGRTPRCPALGPLNTCTVYDVRPMICRTFGMVLGELCQHGCVPDGTITREEMVRVLYDIEMLSREVTGVAMRRPMG